MNFPLNYVSALVLPMQGLLNAIVYIITSQTACRQLLKTLFRTRTRSTMPWRRRRRHLVVISKGGRGGGGGGFRRYGSMKDKRGRGRQDSEEESLGDCRRKSFQGLDSGAGASETPITFFK
ncbi:MAG: hypothetical protein Q9223_007839 [Gallowayella weberi]